MKRKVFLSLFILLTICILTGCGKGAKTADGKTQFTCSKNGEAGTSSLIEGSYTHDSKFVAKVNDDGKLEYFSEKDHYTHDTKESCEKSCNDMKEWNDEINAKGYKGGHRVTTCNCDKNEWEQEKIYDDIPNLSSTLRSDIKQLKDDNTFNVDEWIQKKESNGYNCN